MSLIGLMPALDQYEKTSRQANGICARERERERGNGERRGWMSVVQKSHLSTVYLLL